MILTTPTDNLSFEIHSIENENSFREIKMIGIIEVS